MEWKPCEIDRGRERECKSLVSHVENFPYFILSLEIEPCEIHAKSSCSVRRTRGIA